jgi:CHAT domain-containing protein
LLLGIQLSLEGQIAKSREFFERGLSLAESTLRAEHPDIASLLRNLSKPVKDLGDLTGARALLERAASIAEASVGLEHPLVADCLNDLAGTLLLQGELVAVPDGALNLVPLAALPTARGTYVLETGPVIHYLSAERDLAADEVAQAAAGSGLLAIGGPAFDDASSFAAILKKQPASESAALPAVSNGSQSSPTARRIESSHFTPASGSAALRGASSNCASLRSMQFEALPVSRTEAESVTRLWQRFGDDITAGARSTLTLTGKEATESAFKQLGLGRRVLHIATHGFFLGVSCGPTMEGTRAVGGLIGVGANAQSKQTGVKSTSRRASPPENPLLFSGLALAGANRRKAAGPDEEDGILTAEEIASLNLRGVEWAVLSACDTGLGTVAAGEGVLGLRRAFQVAGVRTVIMSLWSVDDRAARQWMDALYRARLVRQLDTATAMREASVTFIRERRAQGQSTHPFFWASLVAAGDWR